MQLPERADGSGIEIGPSDILAWRQCPMRAKAGRRRLTGKESPESWSAANSYGVAVHYVIERLEAGDTAEQAIQGAFERWRQWLEPSDLARLAYDAEKYLAYEMVGVRTLLSETDISVPLFEHPTAGRVWLRGRIDRLYQSLDDPSLLFHFDYKSSRWPRSYEEVAADPQIWLYNVLIHGWYEALYPEVDDVRLTQTYDQLRFGQIQTQKSPAQREEMRRWAIVAITAMIADEEEAPTFNQFCSSCHLKMECPVVQYELTDWATTKIAALMPREEKRNKDGSLSRRRGKVILDPDRIVEYVELLPDVHRAAQVLGAFEEELRDTLKQMPDSELHRLGKRKDERSRRVFTTEAKRQIVDELGLPTALMIFELSIAGIERFFGEGSQEAQKLAALAEKQSSHTVIADL